VAREIINLIGVLPTRPHHHYQLRECSTIKRIVIHHSATKTGDPLVFARWHVGHCGYPGIAYHYVVSKQGWIWKCNMLQSITYHARGANVDSVGICLVGDFSSKAPQAKQLEALDWLISEILRALPKGVKVVLHRDVKGSKTTCPGALFPPVRDWRTK
jgi:N-acetyl-anhydromuramyl-L-alanine amidase AmpD